MLRRVLEELALFLVPFVLFFGYLLLVGRNPLQRVNWDAQLFRLVLAGLGIVVASIGPPLTSSARDQALPRSWPPSTRPARRPASSAAASATPSSDGRSRTSISPPPSCPRAPPIRRPPAAVR